MQVVNLAEAVIRSQGIAWRRFISRKRPIYSARRPCLQNGQVYFQEYKRGEVVADLEVVGETDRSGTTVHFTPDPEIFTETTEFDFAKLNKRIQELAFLNRGLNLYYGQT